MTERQKQWLNYALVVVLILVSGYFGVRYPLPDMPEYAELEMRTAALEAIAGIEMQAVGPTRFRSITVDHIATVGESLTVPDVTATDDLAVTDDAGVGGDLTVTGGTTAGSDITFANGTTLGEATDTVLDFSEFLAATEQDVFALSAAGHITPTGTYQPITSTAAISANVVTAIMSGTVAGQLLVITNENAADAIVIPDNANTKLGGDKTLTGGEGDAIFLWWDGLDWICVGYNDN